MILLLNSGNTAVMPPTPEAEDEALLMLCPFVSFPITRVCSPPSDESGSSINNLFIIVNEVLLQETTTVMMPAAEEATAEPAIKG